MILLITRVGLLCSGLAVLGGCSLSSGEGDALAATSEIDCAIGNAASFSPDCTVERIDNEDQTILVVRHSDGGFRRFELLGGGGGLVSADGADQATVVDEGANILVTVETDQYRIPVATSGENPVPVS